MDATYSTTLGDRGRLVVPAELRTRQHWEQGTALLFLETDRGVVVMTREQAKTIVRERLAGPSLVDELLGERRSSAHREDAA